MEQQIKIIKEHLIILDAQLIKLAEAQLNCNKEVEKNIILLTENIQLIFKQIKPLYSLMDTHSEAIKDLQDRVKELESKK